MSDQTAKRVCVYILLGYSAHRIAELFEVSVVEVDRLKRRDA